MEEKKLKNTEKTGLIFFFSRDFEAKCAWEVREA